MSLDTSSATWWTIAATITALVIYIAINNIRYRRAKEDNSETVPPANSESFPAAPKSSPAFEEKPTPEADKSKKGSIKRAPVRGVVVGCLATLIGVIVGNRFLVSNLDPSMVSNTLIDQIGVIVICFPFVGVGTIPIAILGELLGQVLGQRFSKSHTENLNAWEWAGIGAGGILSLLVSSAITLIASIGALP